MKSAPHWVDQDRYPFKSRWIKIKEDELHYVDEGAGPVLLFVHGTPEWSFAYRELIRALRSAHRCVAIDLLGFGLSEKPPGGDYTVPDHAARLEKFIDLLGLKNITIVANDFGGGIALPYAIAHPENTYAIVLSNTWMWSLREDPHFSRPAKLIDSWLGRFLYMRMNFPVTRIMPAAYGDRKQLTPVIHYHYKKALPDADARRGAYAFAQELMRASPWWQKQWDALDVLKDKKFLIFWGMKDTFVPVAALEKWKTKLPQAKVVTFDDAGHFVQEEKPAEMISTLRDFLTQ